MSKIEILNKTNDIERDFEYIFYKGEQWKFYDSGLTRNVFVNEDKTKVIKVLINSDGINHNKLEYDIYNDSDDKSEFAFTEISSDNTIVEQEYVEPIKFSSKELTLREILFANSCRGEVGWNKENKLVCFDLDEYKKY